MKRLKESAMKTRSCFSVPLGGKPNYRNLAAICFSLAAIVSSADIPDRFSLQHAEFAKYHRQITGKEPPKGMVRFAIDPKVSKSGKDAYTIVSGSGSQIQGLKPETRNEEPETPCVVITGSNMRSVWYGLYDLLELRGGCHWFWDGDVVPKKERLDFSGLDVKEEANFEYRGLRYFAHRGLTRFQAEHWGPEDWRREIDWIL